MELLKSLFFLMLAVLASLVMAEISVRIPWLNKKARARREAIDLHYDMYDKMLELLDDPTMSDMKWRAWLPIFEAADKQCEKLDPEAAAIRGRVSGRVRRIIGEDGRPGKAKLKR